MALDLHWPADPWHGFDSGLMLERVRRSGCRAVLFPLYHDLWRLSPGFYRAHLVDLERLQALGVEVILRLMWVGRPPAADQYVNAFGVAIGDAMARGARLAKIHNEPQLTGGGEGWGQSDGDAIDFCLWLAGVCEVLDRDFPALRRIFPGLAVQQRDLEWLSAALGTRRSPDLRSYVHEWAAHIYFQWEMWADPEWGERYALYRAALGDWIPLHVLELGDSTPGRSIAEKAEIYCEWDRLAPEWLGNRVVFALGGAGWEEFTLDDAAIDLIGTHNRRERSRLEHAALGLPTT